MRSIRLIGLTVMMIGLGIGFRANGQPGYATLDLPGATLYDINASEIAASPTYRNNVNTRAVRHFSQNFSDVTDERWYYTKKMIVAMFACNGVNYRVDYDKKGRLIETLRSYDETRLSADLKHAVKDAYVDYDILLVQEVEQPLHALVYVINLEGKTKLIDLQVCNGVLFEWRKFDRSK